MDFPLACSAVIADFQHVGQFAGTLIIDKFNDAFHAARVHVTWEVFQRAMTVIALLVQVLYHTTQCGSQPFSAPRPRASGVTFVRLFHRSRLEKTTLHIPTAKVLSTFQTRNSSTTGQGLGLVDVIPISHTHIYMSITLIPPATPTPSHSLALNSSMPRNRDCSVLLR